MWRYQPNAEEEYVGNVWGWKFSIFGAALIVLVIVVAMILGAVRGKSILDSPDSGEVIEQPH